MSPMCSSTVPGRAVRGHQHLDVGDRDGLAHVEDKAWTPGAQPAESGGG